MFRSVVMGEGRLAERALMHLLERGQPVSRVLTHDPRLLNLCARHGIVVASLSGDVAAKLRSVRFDHLWSIANHRILAQDVLQLVPGYCLNFHDSLLPSYAGVHATSWAIARGETVHGVSWHMVSPGIDEGDLVYQRPVVIDEHETAFSLNLKCFEAGFEGFVSLVSSLLERGVLTQTPQARENRSYVGLRERLPRGGFLEPSSTTGALGATCRALSFGPSFNPMGLPKLCLGDDVVVVEHAEVVAGEVGAPLGARLASQAQELRVQTGEGVLLCRGLHRMTPAGLSAVADPGELPGERMVSITTVLADELDTLISAHAYHDAFWARRLVRYAPCQLPVASSGSSDDRLLRRSLPLAGGWTSADEKLLMFTAWLGQLLEVDELWVGLTHDVACRTAGAASGLFAPLVPHRVRLNARVSIREVVARGREDLAQTRRMGTYVRDLRLRVPELETGARAVYSVVLSPAPLTAAARASSPGALTIWVESSGALGMEVGAKHLDQGFWDALGDAGGFMARALARQDDALGLIPLVDEPVRTALITSWAGRWTDYPRDDHLMGLFLQVVARHGSRDALRFDGGSLTYTEVWRRVASLAESMHERLESPLESGEPVLIMCRAGHTAAIAMLAILTLGGSYVPLRVRDPRQRLQQIADDAGARLGLRDVEDDRVLPELAVWLDVMDAAVGPPSGSAARRPVEVAPTETALIIYTSGTTGRPKGACLPHRGIIRMAQNIGGHVPGADDVMLQVSSLAFDGATAELWCALLAGGCVVCPPSDVVMDTARLGEIIEKEGVTGLVLTTALFHHHALSDPSIFARLRFLEAGGEALQPGIANRVLALGDDAPAVFVNGYGPTENTTWTTVQPLRGLLPESEPVPIGRPIDNTTVYVLDRHMRLMPRGVAGELYTGGDGLAAGYLAAPERTAAVFVSNPHRTAADTRAERNARLYRVGDVVRWRGDGVLDFLGRRDHQLKIRGFRVELGEIAAQLGRHDAVQQAVVVPVERAAGLQLVAWVEPHPDARRDGLSLVLAAMLEDVLPDFMRPRALEVVDALPVTPNGKVDRRQLVSRAGELLEGNHDRVVVAPRSDTEAALLPLWEEALRTQPVSVEDDFLELGGHSLLAAELVGRIRAQLGVELSLVDLFEYATIARLAERIDRLERAVVAPAVVSSGPLAPTIPLSVAQVANWRLMRRGQTFFIHTLLRFEHALDPARFEGALQFVLSRHEIFWMHVDRNQPRLVRHPTGEVTLQVEDWRGSDPASHERRAAARVAQMGEREPGPEASNLSVCLIQSAPTRWYVATCIPHIFVDGPALELVFRELANVYAQLEDGQVPQLQPVPMRLQDYVAWEQQHVDAAYVEAGLAHYASVPWQDMRVYPPKTIRAGEQHARLGRVATAELERLRRAARHHGVTLEGLCLYAAFVTCHLVYRTDCFRTMTSHAGRELAEMQHVPMMLSGGVLLQSVWRDEMRFIDGAVAFSAAYRGALRWPLLPSSLIPLLSLIIRARGRLAHFPMTRKMAGLVARWLPGRAPREVATWLDGAVAGWSVLGSWLASKLPWTTRYRTNGCFINVTSRLAEPPPEALRRLSGEIVRVPFPMPSLARSGYLELFRDETGLGVHYQAHYRPESVDAMVETFLGVVRCVADAPEVTLDALRRALRPSWPGFLEPDKAGTVSPR